MRGCWVVLLISSRRSAPIAASMSSICRFEALLQVESLNNLPLSNGKVSVKWHLHDSHKPTSRGKTKAAKVTDHRATFDYSAICSAKLSISSKTNKLRSSLIIFSVSWDHSGHNNSVSLGTLEIDLAQHVINDADEESSSRSQPHTYLLQKSKLNCGLRLSLRLRQLAGPTDYIIPEFVPPKVFSEITGVIHTEKGSKGIQDANIDKLAEILTGNGSFELSWFSKPGYYNPRSTVDDIFMGGDGFNHKTALKDKPPQPTDGATVIKEGDEREDFRSWTVDPEFS